MENPTHSFRETNLVLYLIKNRKSKEKLWWVGACERKKNAFSVRFILSKGNIFNICVLYQCILYWILFQNIHTFQYQKTLLHTPFPLFLKSSKFFSVSLSILVSVKRKDFSAKECGKYFVAKMQNFIQQMRYYIICCSFIVWNIDSITKPYKVQNISNIKSEKSV